MKVKLTHRAEKDLKRLDKPTARRIVRALRDIEEGRKFPEPLSGQYKGLLKLRVGNHRVILQPQDSETVIVRFVRHRSKAYA